MDESTQCRLSAMEMIAQADKEGYEGRWANVAIAGALLEVAAAVWAVRETIGPWMDRTGSSS